jgi:purine-binding chemotaxis protein CheW
MDDSIANFVDGDDETLKGRYLTLQVGKETFGIEIRYVIEIVGLQPVTEMPEMPEHIKGIINLRGKIIPIMDVRLRFKMPAREYDDRTCIIIIDMSGITIGLVIDSVSDVLTISDDEIMKKPEMSIKDDCGYVKNIGRINNKVILLIDCEKLLSANECEEINGRNYNNEKLV